MLHGLVNEMFYDNEIFCSLIKLVGIQLDSEPQEGLKIQGCQYYLAGTTGRPWIGLTDLPKSGQVNPGDDTPDCKGVM